MRYLSVCSGIEAATSAWHHLGWEPVAFSEIEPFPSAVLKHHYPNVPNWGDMTQYKTWPDATIDVLVGGTPCQSFSIAGLRKGLEDPRGNLMLTFLGIADRYRPKYIVWENVPGVLSSNAGRDFGSFLGALGELGYGWAYRVLDAQWFGVAQRRRRVFVVGCLGDQRRAAEVLFKSEGVSRNPAPSRKARKGTAANAEASVAPGSADVCGTLGSEMSKQVSNQMLNQPESWFHPVLMRQREGKDGGGKGPLISEEKSLTLATSNDQVLAVPFRETADALTAAYGTKWNGNASADNGSLFAAQPVNIYGGNKRADRPDGGFYVRTDEETSKCLDAASGLNPTCSQGGTAVMQPVATVTDMRGLGDGHVAPTLRAKETANDFAPMLQTAMQVRRLTPVECERLQGFPDNFTRIPWKKKPAEDCPDGPRYKALGNSMAVPCMKWIGERIGRQAC
jgi:DNA (cytosine-5)-methyltransferase 1